MANIKQEYTLEVVAKGLDGVSNQLKELNVNLGKMNIAQRKNTKIRRKASESEDEYQTRLKGTGKLTNNNTKAFSKMSKGMVGSLVPAYATVAANVFALTAAFGSLERAADLEVLIASSDKLAEVTGRSLTSLAGDMQDITGGAISMKEALTQASLAASAGFNDATINELTVAATNASKALGRDLTDSMNRIFKGAIKAEPELLDELGIILRLQPATKKYAETLGKTAKELTTFEKQQAIVNEVITQANDKFGILSEVEVNPYTKLAAALADVSNSALEWINIPLGGFASLLADNVSILTVGMALLAKNIISLAAPALKTASKAMSSFGINVSETAAAIEAAADNKIVVQDPKIINAGAEALNRYTEAFSTVKNASRTMKKLNDENTSSIKKMDTAIRSISAKLNSLNKGKGIGGLSLNSTGVKAQIVELEKLKEAMVAYRTEAIKNPKAINSIYKFGALKVADLAQSIGLLVSETKSSFVATSAARGPINFLTIAYKQLTAQITELMGVQSAFNKATIITGTIAGRVTGIIAGLASKFLSWIPYIAGFTIAMQLAASAMHALGATDLSAQMDDQAKSLEDTGASIDSYVNNLELVPDTIDSIAAKLKFQANVLNTITSNLDTALKEIKKQSGFDPLDRLSASFNYGSFEVFRENLDEVSKQLSALGYDSEINNLIEDYGRIQGQNRDISASFAKELQNLNTKANVSAQAAAEAAKAYSGVFDSISKNLLAITASDPKLSNTEKSLLDIQDALTGDISGKPDTLLSGLQRLTDVQLRTLGIDGIVNDSSKATLAMEKLIKEKVKLDKEFRGLTGTIYALGSEFYNTKMDRLIKLIADANKKIKESTELQKENRKVAIDALEKARASTKRLVDAQKELNKARIVDSVGKLFKKNSNKSTQSLKDRIDATNLLAKAERNFIAINRKKSVEFLDTAVTSVKNLKAQLETLLINKQDAVVFELPKIETEAINKSIASVTANLKQSGRDVITFGKQVSASSEADAKVLRGQINEQLLNLNKIKNFGGIPLYEESIARVRKELPKLIIALNKAIGTKTFDPKKVTDDAINVIRTVQKFRGTGFKSTGFEGKDLTKINNETLAIKERTASLQREADINKGIVVGFQERIDMQFILKNAQLGAAAAVAKSDAKKRAFSQEILANEDNRKAFVANSLKAALLNVKYKQLEVLANNKLLKQELARKIIADKFSGGDPAIVKELVKELTKLDKLTNKISIAKEFSSAAGSMNELATATERLVVAMNESSADKQVAGLKLIMSLGDSIGGNLGKATKSFAALSLSISGYNKQLEANKAEYKLATENSKEYNLEANNTQAAYAAIGNSAAVLASMFKEGSDAARAFTIVQQGVAIANAAASITNAGTSGDPYSAPARVAAMLSIMTGVLGIAGIAFGGSASGGDSKQQAKEYNSKFNDQNISGIGKDKLTNGLKDGLKELSAIDAKLFSSTRDLQISVSKLNDSFLLLGQQIFNTVGKDSNFVANTTLADPKKFDNSSIDFEQIGAGIGAVFGGAFGGGLGGTVGAVVGGALGSAINSVFGSTTITEEVIAAGIQFSTAIEFTGNSIVASLENEANFSTIQTKKKKKSFFSSSTSSTIRDELSGIDAALARDLELVFSNTQDSIFLGISSLAELSGASVESLFSNFKVNTDLLQFNAFGEDSAKSAAESISSLFSTISNDTIARVLPGMESFRRAGDDLVTTLFRVTANAALVSRTLSTINLDRLSINSNTGIDQAAEDNVVNRLSKSFGRILIRLGLIDLDSEVAKAAQKLRIQVETSWNEALLSEFDNKADFTKSFDRFSSQIFSESELATIALDNANSTISDGFTRLKQQANSLGRSDLVDILDQGNTTAVLREFYSLASDTGAFASIIDKSGNIIDETGARLFGVMTQVGDSFQTLEDIVVPSNAALDDLIKQYERQIKAFGLLGKELDLIQLDFNFKDAIEEAKGSADLILLVETAFGLERLGIVKQYNDEIQSSLKDSFASISSSILEVGKSFKSWDEVLFQSAKINNISKKLGKTLKGVDLSVLEVDTTSLDNFISSFGSIINLSTDNPKNIQEQIDLVEELKTSIVNRYNAEKDAIAKINDGLINLSSGIKDFLSSILISDISPLTNIEKLNEAQNQFTTNLENVLSNDTAVADKAQSGLIESANALLEQASNFYAIGPEFNAIFASVTSSLDNLDSNIISQLQKTSQEKQLEELTNLSGTAISQLNVLNSVLTELQNKQVDTITSDIREALSITMPNALNGITAKLKSINDESWLPLLGIMKNLGSFAVGTNSVAYDQLALIHKGEAIIPQKSAEALRSGSITSGTQFVAPDNSDIVNAINVLTQVLSSTQEDILEQSELTTQATKDNRDAIEANVRVSSTRGIV